MSDYRAIGGVSLTLQALLEDRMELPSSLTAAPVTVGPPRRDSVSPTEPEDPGLCVFLYQVSENSTLKNQDIPGMGHPASRGMPPLSLNLSYLITPFGTTDDGMSTSDAVSQYLLGSAMRVLHDYPIITEELTKIGSPSVTILHESLLGAYEKVKIGLAPISVEDVSKVWTALAQPYRLSAVYSVSVVQIESRRPRRRVQPVGEPPDRGPRIHTLMLPGPRIREVRIVRHDDPANEVNAPYARTGDTIVIEGAGLSGDNAKVLLGGVDITDHDRLGHHRAEAVVANEDSLRPGPLRLQVVRDVIIAEDGSSRRGHRSNVAAIVLVPSIVATDTVTYPGEIEITGTKLFDEGCECLTVIGTHVIEADDYTHKSATAIRMHLPTSTAGDRLAVRVLVNGAESIDESTVEIP